MIVSNKEQYASIPVHAHYSVGEDDTGFYINHYMYLPGESFARRETLYSEIPTEALAKGLEDMLERAAPYLANCITIQD